MTEKTSNDLSSDDMFVVETPSFVLPFIYERPALENLREFIIKLGKNLEEKHIKENDNNNQENDSTNDPENDKTVKKTVKKVKRRHPDDDDDDDPSWHVESSLDSEDETLSDDDAVHIKDKMDSIEDIKQLSDLPVDEVDTEQSNYFNSALGIFFMDIGLNLVQEKVQADLFKEQCRKLSKQRKIGRGTKPIENSIASLSKNLKCSSLINAPFKLNYMNCSFCNFKTESKLVMERHLEIPHNKNNMYKCNFCSYEIRRPSDILLHIETEHKLRGRIEKEPLSHQCPYCSFEDTIKAKFIRHQAACAKKFKEESNLSPPLDWEPPAKIPKISKDVVAEPAAEMTQEVTKDADPQLCKLSGNKSNTSIKNFFVSNPRKTTLPSTGSRPQLPLPSLISKPQQLSPSQQVSVPPPILTSQQSATPNLIKPSFVICELCDGYIKDGYLGSHMQWLHNIKIHPDRLIYSRPPIACQKCKDDVQNTNQKIECRFYTDQGLERHLLCRHGLVSNGLMAASNSGKDNGRCLLCGQNCRGNLLSHVKKDHNMILKPTNLSFKCIVCESMFSTYRDFEKHVYSVHNPRKRKAVEGFAKK